MTTVTTESGVYANLSKRRQFARIQRRGNGSLLGRSAGRACREFSPGPIPAASTVMQTGDPLFGVTVVETSLGGLNNRGEITFRARAIERSSGHWGRDPAEAVNRGGCRAWDRRLEAGTSGEDVAVLRITLSLIVVLCFAAPAAAQFATSDLNGVWNIQGAETVADPEQPGGFVLGNIVFNAGRRGRWQPRRFVAASRIPLRRGQHHRECRRERCRARSATTRAWCRFAVGCCPASR